MSIARTHTLRALVSPINMGLTLHVSIIIPIDRPIFVPFYKTICCRVFKLSTGSCPNFLMDRANRRPCVLFFALDSPAEIVFCVGKFTRGVRQIDMSCELASVLRYLHLFYIICSILNSLLQIMPNFNN